MKRPAATGFSPTRLSATQSFAAMRSKRSAAAAASAGDRRQIAHRRLVDRAAKIECHAPVALTGIHRLTATSSPKLSENRSAIRRADCSSVSSVAIVESVRQPRIREGIDASRVCDIMPGIHRLRRWRRLEESARPDISTALSRIIPPAFHNICTAVSQLCQRAGACFGATIRSVSCREQSMKHFSLHKTAPSRLALLR